LILRFLKAVRIKEKAAAEAEEKRRVDSTQEEGQVADKDHLRLRLKVEQVVHHVK
jgi:hypothetical protein